MICRHCGKQIQEGSVYCPFCGKKIESHLRAEDAYAEEAAYAGETAYAESAREEPSRKRASKGKSLKKALISIFAAIVFVGVAFILIMVFAKPYLGEEPWEQDETAQTEEIKLEEVKKMYVASEDGLMMRDGPGQDSAEIHILNYGQEVRVEKINEGWAYVTADGISGWVTTDYLTNDKIEVAVTEKTPESEEDRGKLVEPSTRIKSGAHGIVDSEGGLNLRCGPGKDYDILLVVPDKTEVVEEGRDGDWIFIKYDGEYGWINTEYIAPVSAE